MKKIILALTLSGTFLMIGCNPPIGKIKELSDIRKIQVCTKGSSTSCDSKYRITLDQVSLVSHDEKGNYLNPPHTIATENGVVFSVEIHGETKYFGATADWKETWKSIKNLNPAQQDHALTLFFQEQFDTIGWLHQKTDIISDNKGGSIIVYKYEYHNDHGNYFSETSVSIKDLEGMGAEIEAVRNEGLANKLVANYGLSAERATSVARNLSTYKKLALKRALTAKEKNFFAKELLGVNFNAAKDAFVSGDKKDMDNLLETAADVNETSPEQVSAIITEMFL